MWTHLLPKQSDGKDQAIPSLWIPGSEADAILARGEGMREAKRVLNDFYPRLKALDPRFDCFLQTERTDELRQGYWHVIRRNEDGTIAFWEVSNPDGSYREPDDAVLHALQAGDANRRQNTFAELRKREDAKRRANERAQERKREEQREHLQERADHAFRVQIAPGAPLRHGKLKG